MKATLNKDYLPVFNKGIIKINLDLSKEDIRAYRKAESSKLSPEICNLLDSIIDESEYYFRKED
jgi:hypothetical protein